MLKGLLGRVQHTRRLFGRVWRMIGGAYAFFGAVIACRSRRLGYLELLPHWDLSWWLVGGLAILVMALIEGSFRLDRGLRLELETEKGKVNDRATLQQELLELKKQILPRSISGLSAQKMVERLLKKPKAKVDLYYLSAHKEPRDLATQLREILTRGGWEVTRFGEMGGAVPSGVEISVRDADDPPPQAAELQALLEGDGIPTTWGPGNNEIWESDYVYVFVGSRD